MTWNNRPTCASDIISGQVSVAASSGWCSMDVKAFVQGWADGTPNYGFTLKEPNESNPTTQKTKYYSSDAPYPNRPELRITYGASSGETDPPEVEVQYGSRGYDSVGSGGSNCMGYALECPYAITFSTVGFDPYIYNEASLEELESGFALACQAWMTTTLGGADSWGIISAYNTPIEVSTYYRTVMRMGVQGSSGTECDTYMDKGQAVDFHWWYQTKDGRWADKMGTGGESNLISGSYGINPLSSHWNNHQFCGPGRFYMIKDTRPSLG